MKLFRAKTLAMQAIYHFDFNNKSLEQIVKFQWVDFDFPEEEKEYAIKVINGVIENQEYIDNIIRQYSENWSFERISSVNLAILRIAIYQLKFTDDEEDKDIIDYSLKLATKFSEEDANRYINGFLENYNNDIKEEL